MNDIFFHLIAAGGITASIQQDPNDATKWQLVPQTPGTPGAIQATATIAQQQVSLIVISAADTWDARCNTGHCYHSSTAG